MKMKLIRVGDARALRLPKALLERCGFADEIELEIEDDHLIIHSSKPIRHGWDAAFARMRARGDDCLFDVAEQRPANKWDQREWRW
jgi:antitoxin MazE